MRTRLAARLAAVVVYVGLISCGMHGRAQAAVAPFPGFSFSANAEGKAEITAVSHNAEASAADLLPHDVITAVNGVDVTAARLEAVLKTIGVGTSIVIDLVRPPLNIPMQRSVLNAPKLSELTAKPGWIIGRCVTTTGAPLKDATVRLSGIVHGAMGVTTPRGPQLTDDTYVNIPVAADGHNSKRLPNGLYATSGWATVTFEGKTYKLPLTELGRQNVKYIGGHRNSRTGIVQDFCLDTRMGSISISDLAFDRPAPLGPPGTQVLLALVPQELVPGGSFTRRYRDSWILPAPGHVIGTHTAKGIPLGRYTMTVSIMEPDGTVRPAMMFGGAVGINWVSSASVLIPLEGIPAPGAAMPVTVDPTRSH